MRAAMEALPAADIFLLGLFPVVPLPVAAWNLAHLLRAPARMLAKPCALIFRLPLGASWGCAWVPKIWFSSCCSPKIRSWMSAARRSCWGVRSVIEFMTAFD